MNDSEKQKFNRNRFLTRRLEDKLDKMVGFYFWKTYVASTLYANISTPMNLTITVFTALMTAHSSTSSSFISNDLNMKMNLITFVVSILNSYFTPQKEFNELNEYLIKWSDIGNRFEKAIYTSNTYEQKISSYTGLLDEANSLYKDQYLKKRNFLTDLLHTFFKLFFMNSNDRWMRDGTFDFYEKINDVVELDFDLEEFKYKNKKASVFERICSCFTCCFKCFRKNNNSNKRSYTGNKDKQGRNVSVRLHDEYNNYEIKSTGTGPSTQSVAFEFDEQYKETIPVPSLLSETHLPSTPRADNQGPGPDNNISSFNSDEKKEIELTDIKIN